jgi:hypothetical protein
MINSWNYNDFMVRTATETSTQATRAKFSAPRSSSPVVGIQVHRLLDDPVFLMFHRNHRLLSMLRRYRCDIDRVNVGALAKFFDVVTGLAPKSAPNRSKARLPSASAAAASLTLDSPVICVSTFVASMFRPAKLILNTSLRFCPWANVRRVTLSAGACVRRSEIGRSY